MQTTSGSHGILSDKDRKEIQQEIKNYLVKYLKKNSDRETAVIKVDLYKDMMLIRLEGFLTDSEKSDAGTQSGSEAVRNSRGQDAKQNIIANMETLEKKLNAKVFYQTFDIDPAKDFATFLFVFDRILTD